MAGGFELYQDRVGKLRFRLQARNGQTAATRAAYETAAADVVAGRS